MDKNRYILIVDDDEDDRNILADAIGESDDQYICIQAIGGVEAFELLAGLPELPILIFLDLNMPRMNGMEFLSKIKQNADLKTIPVIIYSTSARTEDISESKRSGAVHFLTKPVMFSEICREVNGLLHRKW